MPEKLLQFPQQNPFTCKVSYGEIDKYSLQNQHESHIHEQCEIYLNLTGDVSFEVEDHLYPIFRGSIILTRPYEYHHCLYHSDALHKNYCIWFDPAENEPLLRPFFQRRQGQDNLIQLEEDELQMLCGLLNALLHNDLSLIEQQLAFFKILRLLESQDPIQHSAATPALSREVRLALQYMEQHLSQELTTQELARAAHVSVNTLERYFRKELQTTPLAALRKKRLIRASGLLRNGRTLAEACELSGFSDYSHFIQLFRRQFGITPLRYQNHFTKA